MLKTVSEAIEYRRSIRKFNPKKDLTYYSAIKQKYIVDKGDFEIQVGSSSQDIRLRKIIHVN